MTITTRAAFAAFLFAFGAAITSQTANATMGHHKATIIRTSVTDTTVSRYADSLFDGKPLTWSL